MMVVVVGATALVSCGSPSDPEFEETLADLNDVFEAVRSSFTIDPTWEGEYAQIRGGGLALTAWPDLSVGNRLYFEVRPNPSLETGQSAEDRALAEFSAADELSEWELTKEPSPIRVAGVDGYVYEAAGPGNKTGQPLGTVGAILFGTEYSYGVFVQYELADEAEMRLLFERILEEIELPDAASSVT
jgi:hypothetical protein